MPQPQPIFSGPVSCCRANFHVFSRLGAALAAQKQWDKAVKSYSTAIEIASDSNDYLARGRAYLELKAADKAMADFTTGREFESRQRQGLRGAWRRLTWTKTIYRTRLPIIARRSGFARADASAYPQSNARLLRASADLAAGKKAKRPTISHMSCDCFREMTPRISKAYLEAIDGLVEAYADAGEFADAAKWAENSIDLAPDAATKEKYRQRLRNTRPRHRPLPKKSP